MNPFTPSDRAMFQKFRVSRELVERFHIERVTDAEARAFGVQYSFACDLSGLWFPYFSFHEPTKRVSGRLRRDRPEINENGEPKHKWLCTFGDRRHLFFSRDAKERLRSPEAVVVLVESEKSVIALTAWAERTGRNILPVGLGGCWGWTGRIGKTQNAHGERIDETGPLPDLLACCEPKREVIIVFDSNVATNPKVRAAERQLTQVLVSNGARVRIARLPQVSA